MRADGVRGEKGKSECASVPATAGQPRPVETDGERKRSRYAQRAPLARSGRAMIRPAASSECPRRRSSSQPFGVAFSGLGQFEDTRLDSGCSESGCPENDVPENDVPETRR